MLEKTPCERIIHPSSKEKKKDYKKFWLILFEALEHDAAIPFHKRYSVLSTMFKSLKDILTGVYKLEEMQAPELLKQFFSDQHAKLEEDAEQENIILSRVPTSVLSIMGDDDILEILQSPVGLKTFANNTDDQTTDAGRRIGHVNPYVNFFKLAKMERAAIWRQLPKSSYTHLEIEEKVIAVVDYVADEFVNWTLQMWDLTDQRHVYVDAVKKMFNVEVGMHVAKTMCLRLKQMTSIPDVVAQDRGIHHLSEKANLRKQLKRDIAWCTAKENNPEERLCNVKKYAQLREQITTKWTKCLRYPKNLISMETVWEGTSHLKSTRKFCEYLIDHPKIHPPKYLIDTGLLNKEFLKQQEESEAELHYLDDTRLSSSLNLT